jgi:hypothetical protein
MSQLGITPELNQVELYKFIGLEEGTQLTLSPSSGHTKKELRSSFTNSIAANPITLPKTAAGKNTGPSFATKNQ